MKIKTANYIPFLLPPQQLSACRSTRHRRAAARDTQTAPADNQYKPVTFPAVIFSQFPIAALEVDIGNLPTGL